MKALRDQVQERINEDTDSINKIANETTSMKEITDELKTGDDAKDVLEDYNSEACVDSLKGLNEEMEFLKGMDLETMNADSLENLAGKLHQVDLSKFSDTSSYKELWNNVRQSVGQESIQGVPMDFIDGIFALLSIDTLYDEDLNSKIDLNYYGKLPSQRIRSAQEYSLDSPFEKEDQKTAQDNLNKIGLPISEADSVELDGGINVGGQADDDGEGQQEVLVLGREDEVDDAGLDALERIRHHGQAEKTVKKERDDVDHHKGREADRSGGSRRPPPCRRYFARWRSNLGLAGR